MPAVFTIKCYVFTIPTPREALHIPVVNTMYTLWSDSLTCDVRFYCMFVNN